MSSNASNFKDGEIPSAVGELSNLQELDLSDNKFTRIDFSLSQLTQLKLLNLEECNSLVELPELPSSLAILHADKCKSLTSVGDCHKDCKSLCQVSLRDGGIVSDGGCRLLESMLQGNAIDKDHPMLLQLEGIEIAKALRSPRICKGSRYTLQLPNNWRDDFCGFLLCAVLPHGYEIKISMKQPMMSDGMDSGQNDDVLNWEGVRDTHTWVGYISFGLLRHTCWWDHHTCNTLSFSIDEDRYNPCNGFGVRLVSRNNSRDGRLIRETSTTVDSSSHQLSDYKPRFKILHDSASALTISLGERDP